MSSQDPRFDLHAKLIKLLEDYPELTWTISEDSRGLSLSVFYEEAGLERKQKRSE